MGRDMILWISVAVLFIGLGLCWIEQAGFRDDSVDIRWRPPAGLGQAGLTLVACAIGGLIWNGLF